MCPKPFRNLAGPQWLALMLAIAVLALSIPALSAPRGPAPLILGKTPALSTPNQGPAPLILGKTFGEWSAKWWQWIYSIPAATNPLVGGDCSQNQSGPVWFLAGTMGSDPVDRVERDCTVPAGKALFFPLVTVNFHNGPDEDYTVEEKKMELEPLLNLGCTLRCTMDDDPVVFNHLTPIVRTQSPPYRLEISLDNIYGWPYSVVDPEAVSDGFWVMLPHLSPGKHTLNITGGLCGSGWAMYIDVTYNLTILH